MKTWRIRVRKQDVPICIHEEYSNPTRKGALKYLKEGRELGGWTMYGILGAYVEAYEKRFHVKFRVIGAEVQGVLDNLRSLVRFIGVTDSLRAIEAVFTLKWIVNKHDVFLSNTNNYAVYLVPAIAHAQEALKPAGESSEWAGKRSAVPCRDDEASKNFFK